MRKFYSAILILVLAACSSQPPQEAQIENSQHEPIYLQISGQQTAEKNKLAIIQHGLASDMTHPAVRAAKQAFIDNGYLVITFDSRYSLGKSGGWVANVRLSTFVDDLQTVIDWAKKQNFYHEPLALAGHSLGGASVLQYAAEHPAQVGILVPITPVVSGQKWEDACMTYMPDFCRKWKKDGVYRYQNEDISYQTVEKAKSFDALKLAPKIAADVLLISAQNDTIIIPKDINELYAALPESDKKRLAKIPNSGHNFEDARNQQDLTEAVNNFLK